MGLLFFFYFVYNILMKCPNNKDHTLKQSIHNPTSMVCPECKSLKDSGHKVEYIFDKELDFIDEGKINLSGKYKVVLNDSGIAKFDTCVDILSEVFTQGSRMKANLLMWHSHQTGKVECFSGDYIDCENLLIRANKEVEKYTLRDKYASEIEFEIIPN